ncbi:MAG: di-heme oxidoredictase family protein, partial [Myxococcota bacterium]
LTLFRIAYGFSSHAVNASANDTPVQTRFTGRLQLIGLGLLEAVDQGTIEGFAQRTGGKVPSGRFGWKATQPTIEAQVRKAFSADMGVTNPSRRFVDRIVDYIRGIGVPIRRHPTAQANQQPNTALRIPDAQTITDSDILAGEAAFAEAGCDGCHIPSMTTGNSHPVPQFRNITIRPFTDLLLWDMGPALCADRGEGDATACEWRTPPLWGTRLQAQVTGHDTFLHDGRATTRDQAIRAHGGDAQAARDAYVNFSASKRQRLIRYLQSL